MLQLAPGDICEVSLVTYEVVGRVQNRARNAVVLTLQDGSSFRYLHVEERETTRYALYTPIDGRLDALTRCRPFLNWTITCIIWRKNTEVWCRPWAERLMVRLVSSLCGSINRMITNFFVWNGKTEGLTSMRVSPFFLRISK